MMKESQILTFNLDPREELIKRLFESIDNSVDLMDIYSEDENYNKVSSYF